MQSASVCERDPRLRFPGGTSFVKCKCEDVELELTSSRLMPVAESVLLGRASLSVSPIPLTHSLSVVCFSFRTLV